MNRWNKLSRSETNQVSKVCSNLMVPRDLSMRWLTVASSRWVHKFSSTCSWCAWSRFQRPQSTDEKAFLTLF